MYTCDEVFHPVKISCGLLPGAGVDLAHIIHPPRPAPRSVIGRFCSSTMSVLDTLRKDMVVEFQQLCSQDRFLYFIGSFAKSARSIAEDVNSTLNAHDLFLLTFSCLLMPFKPLGYTAL